MKRNPSIVPALMFHSAGLEDHPWVWNHISEPVASFEAKIARLKARGFTGVFWADVYDHMAGVRTLPEDSILLTFDDGYLDNWVHVYPILKRYDMKGTIFVSPDFVDPTPGIRPNSDDVVAGRCSAADLQVTGFLNWAEMREMERSGLVDIQSHAMTHTWYFNGPRIKRFHAPHQVAPYPWLFWNARPERKPFYLNEDQQEFVPWGLPILEHGKSLETRRFFPDEDAMALFASFVAERGARVFFERPDWQTQLEELSRETFPDGKLPGTYESDEAMRDRLKDELQRSKQLIEQNLEKAVNFLCWPGGANDKAVQMIAHEVGYRAWTLGSNEDIEKRNAPGEDPVSIKRISTGNDVGFRGKTYRTAGPFWQMWRIYSHQGSMLHSMFVRGLTVFEMSRAALRPR